MARCSAAVAPPPVVVGREGVDQVGNEGQAELGNGIAASVVAGKGAIDPSGIPPMVWCGWEGWDQAGIEGQAKLGNGVAASVVAGKGAINPEKLPPMVWCGWEGAASGIVSLLRSHNAEYSNLSCSSSRIHPNLSAYWLQEW